MNFRRQPFQFTSIDPVKRHAELQKRFGLTSDDMLVDCANPGLMGAGEKDSVINGSPRLQHRVPIFSQGVHPTKTTNVSNNVDSGHQPRVRVIPIQVEGVNDVPRRQMFPGSALKSNDVSSRFDPQPKLVKTLHENEGRPRVCNIPIKVESNNKAKGKESKETVIPTVIEQKEQPPEISSDGVTVPETQESCVSKSLKKIEDVLDKFKEYQVQVEEFTGTNKSKMYRYLDEMLTRCMLELDDVDTFGDASVRQSRKNAVKQVQACIDLLETKIMSQSTADITVSDPPSVVEPADNDSSVAQLDVSVPDVEMKDCATEVNNSDVLMENENSIEDSAVSSQPTQVCDIEMEDKSFEGQSSKEVKELEKSNENSTEEKIFNDNITPTSIENQGIEVVEETSKEVEGSLNSEKAIKSNSEEVASELVIEEMCSDKEINDDFEISAEPVISEPNSSELPELSDSNISKGQTTTFKLDQGNFSEDNEKISITEIPNTIDTIIEES